MKLIEKILKIFTGLMLFLLPWQTIFIYKETFLNGDKLQYGTLGFYATEGILFLTTIFFIIWFSKKKKINITNKFKFTKERIFLLALILFLIYALASRFWAINSDISGQNSLHLIEAVIFFLIILLGPLKFRESTIIFILGATIQSIFGIWQFLTQTTFAFKWLGLAEHSVIEAGTSIISSPEVGRWMRAYGAFPHPNIFGGYLVISLMLTGLTILKSKKNSFLFINFLTTLQITALFFTFSRSAWIAFFVFFISVIFFIRQHKKIELLEYVFVPILLFIILSIIYFPLIQTRFSQNSVNEITSTTERVSGLKESLQIITKNPILGVGHGNYSLALFQLNNTRPGWEYQPVHNVFLLILAELGFLGLILNYIFIGLYLKCFDPNTSKKILLLISPILFLLLFDHYLWSSYTGILIFGAFLAFTSRFYLNKY
ncbi:MAG: hypothetical protein A2725_02130 [Candidatus Magasanikbacteria bacterium RIFCSPHIGHO2_01_FULL_33_34]|uniref:O-antigen ligase-related domain-containing protein n=1 Tax=Candidatus Magasanikbacteria bacterium RIFCSPHIGHO2_01_FULL_33_34 TaxID=1798671 RepID=A0A1F6LKF6_9BACT|nr:MAG: hypothetical protein A2725_02130 [Candidatus Magasanikbacteria bacterium RIFCSPHIGHO2_01_FULL_33_34]OGH65566.1 MAG: hypothetical protein A3B83_01705 [Candidatus Magasanikbacteria bacterium RIFCSPHIGHO2_02_FULL_33_17]OGH76276.1 MAG: hypothetical protein A3A89_02525 [Candidatus Magasanikbacteria bacterium RIFCSPLOWO2_01_FULL_33_34]OGH81427.1 MAG: hypothetical protein A3F93_02935 [Candidatus Magasanikbacteria bacterium RIFCSPLOWO2_12_FULL_34_7]